MERVRFHDVVQRFRLIQERPDTLRDAFAHLFKKKVSYHDFEALKGVSFGIRKGETVAIIGRNWSGKSTILKIIAGVYHATSGLVTVSGNVGPHLHSAVKRLKQMTFVRRIDAWAVIGYAKPHFIGSIVFFR